MEKISEKAKNFYYEFIRKPVEPATDSIVKQIRDTSQKLECAYERFENEINEDLLDSIIYEIKSLKSLYRYLLKLAKEKGLESDDIAIYSREVI